MGDLFDGDPPDRKRRSKRRRPMGDLSFGAQLGSLGETGRYLHVTCETQGRVLGELNGFVMGRFLKSKLSSGFRTHRRGKEFLILFANSAQEADAFAGTHEVQGLNGVSVKVEIHRGLNQKRGVIVCPELRDVPEQEILDEMRESGVAAVRKMNAFRDGRTVPTNSVLLTFDRLRLPMEVTVGHLRVPVLKYYDNPMQCRRCYKFGHTQMRCKDSQMCERCAFPIPHEECGPLKCVNCGEGHASNDRRCLLWVKEKGIRKIMTDRELGYMESKRIWDDGKSQGNATFAGVLGKGGEGNVGSSNLPLGERNQLEARINELFGRLSKVEAENKALRRENAELKAKIANPSNLTSGGEMEARLDDLMRKLSGAEAERERLRNTNRRLMMVMTKRDGSNMEEMEVSTQETPECGGGEPNLDVDGGSMKPPPPPRGRRQSAGKVDPNRSRSNSGEDRRRTRSRTRKEGVQEVTPKGNPRDGKSDKARPGPFSDTNSH